MGMRMVLCGMVVNKRYCLLLADIYTHNFPYAQQIMTAPSTPNIVNIWWFINQQYDSPSIYQNTMESKSIGINLGWIFCVGFIKVHKIMAKST